MVSIFLACQSGDMDTFLCAKCGGEFEKGVSDEEARAEAKHNFPAIDFDIVDESDPAMPVLICDDCYKAIMGPGGKVT